MPRWVALVGLVVTAGALVLLSLQSGSTPSVDPARASAGEPVAPADAGEAQAYVVLRVSDEGPGIARQHLPRLSERFYRVEGQRTGGTGLGLAIVKHVVNRHRGGLIVESAEGEGATFSVYLPMAPVSVWLEP